MSGSVQNLASASTALNSVEANSNKEFNQPKVEKSKTSLSGRQVTFLVGAVVLGTVALVSAAALAAIFVPPVAAAIPAIALGGVTLLLGLQLTLGTAAVVSGLGALVLLAGSLFKGSKANEESKDLSSQRPFSQEADIDLGIDPTNAPAPAAHSSSSSVSKTNEQQDTGTHLSSPLKINDESSTVSVSVTTSLNLGIKNSEKKYVRAAQEAGEERARAFKLSEEVIKRAGEQAAKKAKNEIELRKQAAKAALAQ